MFYLRHTCNVCVRQFWCGLRGMKSVQWGGGGVVDCGGGLKKSLFNTVYIGYSTVSVLLSVGSVTKARLRCSCDEPSSDAVMCSVSSAHLGLFCRFSSFSSVLCLLSSLCLFWGGGSVAPEGPRHGASPVSSLAVILHS